MCSVLRTSTACVNEQCTRKQQQQQGIKYFARQSILFPLNINLFVINITCIHSLIHGMWTRTWNYYEKYESSDIVNLKRETARDGVRMRRNEEN